MELSNPLMIYIMGIADILKILFIICSLILLAMTIANLTTDYDSRYAYKQASKNFKYYYIALAACITLAIFIPSSGTLRNMANASTMTTDNIQNSQTNNL